MSLQLADRNYNSLAKLRQVLSSLNDSTFQLFAKVTNRPEYGPDHGEPVVMPAEEWKALYEATVLGTQRAVVELGKIQLHILEDNPDYAHATRAQRTITLPRAIG